jgi:hypothetical protein
VPVSISTVAVDAPPATSAQGQNILSAAPEAVEQTIAQGQPGGGVSAHTEQLLIPATLATHVPHGDERLHPHQTLSRPHVRLTMFQPRFARNSSLVAHSKTDTIPADDRASLAALSNARSTLS